MNNIEVENPNPQPELGFPDPRPSPSDEHHDDHDHTDVDNLEPEPLNEKLQIQLSLKETEPETEEWRDAEDCYKDENFTDVKSVKDNGEDDNEDGWDDYVPEEKNYYGWDDDLVEKKEGHVDGEGDGYAYGDGWGEMEENKDNESSDVNGGERNVNGNGFSRDTQFPIRPGAEDCAFYMKTGNCKFGAECKFNHPARRRTQVE